MLAIDKREKKSIFKIKHPSRHEKSQALDGRSGIVYLKVIGIINTYFNRDSELSIVEGH